jgi:hypothetical protein
LPAYFFEKIRNPAKTPNNGRTKLSGSCCVATVAILIAIELLESEDNEELLDRYSGTACIMKGKKIKMPRTIGKNQKRLVFRVVLNIFGLAKMKSTMQIVIAAYSAALSECVKNIDPAKIDVDTRNGVIENFSLCKYK